MNDRAPFAPYAKWLFAGSGERAFSPSGIMNILEALCARIGYMADTGDGKRRTRLHHEQRSLKAQGDQIHGQDQGHLR